MELNVTEIVNNIHHGLDQRSSATRRHFCIHRV